MEPENLSSTTKIHKNVCFRLEDTNNLLPAWIVSPGVDYLGVKKPQTTTANYFKIKFGVKNNFTVSCYAPSHQPKDFFSNQNSFCLRILIFFFS